jgi:hypothetical protein
MAPESKENKFCKVEQENIVVVPIKETNIQPTLTFYRFKKSRL